MDVNIAYFSAEIGLNDKIKTYSGGLGILAGGMIKAMADISYPFCAVTLLYKKGFFKQKIVNDTQTEEDDIWNYKNILTDTNKYVKVNISNTEVLIKIWSYEYTGITGFKIPIFFLDTDIEQNPDWVKKLTEHLYIGDRISQEIVLGVGGYRALNELGITPQKVHMNEGHSSFLTLELLKEYSKDGIYNYGEVKARCVFTTHTPIPAGHDRFNYGEVYEKLNGEKDIIPPNIKELAGENELVTTKLAMSLSSYVNAVSKKHLEVTKQMFPEYTIDYITNGIHVKSWTSKYMKNLFDKYISGWQYNYDKLSEVINIPDYEILSAHNSAKEDMIRFINENNVVNSNFKNDILTIGFARRFVAYKDAELILQNIDFLKSIGKKVQIVYAGKAHETDYSGKEILKRIIQKAENLKEIISIAFIEDYSIEKAKLLVSGCDLWLNTPIPPNEASGTSGMKAAVNGVPHFSRLDGWAIESFEMNGGGFPINGYNDMISTLKYKIIPMFYSENKFAWIREMKLSIAISGNYFNTHRMVKEYIKKAYKI